MRKLKTQLSFPGLTFQVILPRSSWPNDFGERFLGAFSPAPSRADYLAIDAGYQLFKGFLQGEAECVVTETQLLFKLGGPENMQILVVNLMAVHVLAVNRPLPLLYRVKKCVLHSIQCQNVNFASYVHSVIYTLSVMHF